MATNQTTSPWRSDKLCDFVVSSVKKGVAPRDIAQLANSTFKIRLTKNQVEKYLARNGLSWSMFAPDGIPAELIEPPGGFAVSVRAPKRKHPEGWEPCVEVCGDEATVILDGGESPTMDEKRLMEGSDLDPKEWRLADELQYRKWPSQLPVEENSTDCRCEEKQTVRHYESRWNYYYKCRLLRRVKKGGVDVQDLIDEIKKRKPSKRPVGGDTAFIAVIADWQLGKDDNGGTAGIVRRVMWSIDAVERRVRELRRTGVQLDVLYVLGLGDIIENCANFYAQQSFRVELNRRDQCKLARRLIVSALERWAPLFDKVVVAAVAGNHGENRADGKSFTTFGDNDDVAIFEQVQEIMSSNPAFDHVSFLIPNDRLDLTLDIHGTIVGLAHGHQAGGGATPSIKLMNWWMKQAHGMQAIGDAEILFSGHFHSLQVSQSGRKTHIQAPALEGGSDWFRNVSGLESPPGFLTLTIDQDGWDNLRVLRERVRADDERVAVLDTRLKQRAAELSGKQEKVAA